MKNFSIIVNHGSKEKFGCRRRCEYCNWQRLRGFTTSKPDITKIKLNKAKGYITISGGGDPLCANFIDSVMEYIPDLIAKIRKIGRQPRIITREISVFRSIKKKCGHIYLSLSYDTMTIREILKDKDNIDTIRQQARTDLFEMTMVIDNHINIKSIMKDLVEISKLKILIGTDFPITIRENLRSALYLDKKDAKYILAMLRGILRNENYFDTIRWLPAKVCLEDNMYIIEKMGCFNNRNLLSGRDITPNYEMVASYLTHNEHTLVFGGFARYYLLNTELKTLDPYFNDAASYSDIDAFVEVKELNNVLDVLAKYGFSIKKVLSRHRIQLSSQFDRQFLIDINIVDNIETAKTIVSEGDISITRLCVHDGNIIKFKGFSERELICMKGRLLAHSYKFLNLKRREMSEKKLLDKFILKGWKISKMSFIEKIKKFFYKLKGKRKHVQY